MVGEWKRPDFIDLNFGCPVNKVVSKNGGSSLLRDCPLLERVAHKINLAGQVLRLEESMADNAQDVRGTVYWQVLEPERADAVIDQVDQLIRRGAIAAMHDEPQAGEAADRRVLGTRMKLALNSALRERGMMVTRVDLDLA